MSKLREVRAFLDSRGVRAQRFADIVRGIRLYMGWKPWQVAQIINTSETTYKRAESGKRSFQKEEVQSLDAALKANGEFVECWLKMKFSLGKKKTLQCANTGE